MTHILIVSPNTLSAKAISMALQGVNVDIHCAASTRCVIEICCEHRIELLVFLTLTPYFCSMNIVDELKARLERMPTIYVISHSHSQSTIITLLECGVDQYMTFPLNLYRLRQKVYSLIENTTTVEYQKEIQR